MFILQHRAFGLLWASTTIAGLGAWLLTVALPVHVLAMTGSPIALSVTVVAEAAPAVLLAPVAGLLPDTLDRRRLLLAGHLARAGVLVGMATLGDGGPIWPLWLLIGLSSALTQVVQPAYRALLPAIVGRGPDLDTANGWTTAGGGVVRLCGAPLGGVVYGLTGFAGTALSDAACYILAALLLLGIRRTQARPQNLPTDEPDRHSFPSRPLRRAVVDVRAGYTFLIRHRLLRSLLLVSSLFLFANGMLDVLVVPLVTARLHGGAGTVGLIFSGLGAGFLASAVLGRYLSRRWNLRWSLLVVLTAVTGAFALLFHAASLTTALTASVAIGLTGGSTLLLIQVGMQRASPDPFLGRIASTFTAVEMAATILGSITGGSVATTATVQTAADLALPLTAATAIIAALLLRERKQ